MVALDLIWLVLLACNDLLLRSLRDSFGKCVNYQPYALIKILACGQMATYTVMDKYLSVSYVGVSVPYTHLLIYEEDRKQASEHEPVLYDT